MYIYILYLYVCVVSDFTASSEYAPHNIMCLNLKYLSSIFMVTWITPLGSKCSLITSSNDFF